MCAAKRSEPLDHAERWMRNGLEACSTPGFSMALEADMEGCRAFIAGQRERGLRITYTHLFVHAAAVALSRHPDLHQMMSASRRCRPGQVNIALSVAGASFVAPLCVIQDAAEKSVTEIADAVVAGAPLARAEQQRSFANLRRWGWLVPFSFMRRALLRVLMPRMLWKHQAPAVLQVTGVPGVDGVTPFLLLSTAVLAVGQVKEKPAAVRGAIRSRLQVTLTCSVDHRVWDGLRAARFLNEVKSVLESLGPEQARLEPERGAARGAGRLPLPIEESAVGSRN